MARVPAAFSADRFRAYDARGSLTEEGDVVDGAVTLTGKPARKIVFYRGLKRGEVVSGTVVATVPIAALQLERPVR